MAGNPRSTVTVDIYEDLLCPICGAFERATGMTVQTLIKHGKTRVVFHPIASLNDASNPPGYSGRAANALACMPTQQGFVNLQAALYRQQPKEGGAGLTDRQLVAHARKFGSSDASVAMCITTHRYARWVTTITKAAENAGVTGTPTVRVNGKRITHPDGDPPLPKDLTKAVTAAR
ncbi:MAG: DsbA family protein [Mycobacteriales bacterium]